MSSNMDVAALLHAEIERYPRSYQRRLRKFVSVSPRLGDVVVSFPALAFALVSQYGTADQRGRAVALIKCGAPLKQVAGELGLPMWLRKLPPEAFVEPLGDVPSGDAFARRVANALPDDSGRCGAWLRWLLAGYRNCDSRFAVWIASQPIFGWLDRNGEVPVAPIAAYAWYSGRPQSEFARGLIRKPWQPSMGYATAVAETGAWVARVAEASRPVVRPRGPGRYSRRNAMKGLHFVVLQTGAELREEGQLMDHCVGSYAHEVARGRCVIVSVRRGVRPIATMEVAARKGVGACPHVIVQLRGRANASPPSAVWKVAHTWVESNGELPLSQFGAHERGVDRHVWERVWAPYVASKGAGVFRGGGLSVGRLLRDVEQLEQLG